MSERGEDTGSLSDRAIELERLYDWARAAELYRKTLESTSKADSKTIGRLLEREAFALYKSALQSESLEEFRNRVKATVDAYSRAMKALDGCGDGLSLARADRCRAMLALMGFHVSENGDERRIHSKDSWTAAMRALRGFEDASAHVEYRKTFNDLSVSAVTYTDLLPDYQTRQIVFDEAMDAGEKAARPTRDDRNTHERIKALIILASLLERAATCDLTARDPHECSTKAREYWKEAESLSKEQMLAELPFAAFVGDAPIDPKRDMEAEYNTFLQALEVVRRSRDRFMTGHVLIGMSFYAHWVAASRENEEDMMALMNDARRYIVEAGAELARIGFVGSRGANLWHMAPHHTYEFHVAILMNDPMKIRKHAEAAILSSAEAMDLARASGYTYVIGGIEMDIGHSMTMLARTEPDTGKKRSLLTESVELIRHSLTVLEPFDSGNLYNLGVWHLILAEAQGDLAEVAADPQSRTRQLREAIESHKTAIEEHNRGLKSIFAEGDPGAISVQGYEDAMVGQRYQRLFELTGDQEALRDALGWFDSSAERYVKAEMPSRAAESQWAAAVIQDRLDDHDGAADRFMLASAGYRAGSEKVKRLESLYSEYAAYMEAWAEFERAKRSHLRQEYERAREHFGNAAAICDSLPRWRFLATNHRAWALLDRAEGDSREDRSAEASKSFNDAADLFKEADKSMEDAERVAQSADEKAMIARLRGVSTARQRYCMARATIETARMMNLDGKHSSGCEMYGRAANELEDLADKASSKKDEREMKLIATISRAWERMNKAEAELSSEPYREAAHLFEEAKDLTEDARTKALTLGHSRFCRALEAGVRFTDSRDEDLHAIATKNLESASSYYLKGGSDACAEYARASKLLFDAYAFLDDASHEKDHKKAAKAYTAADKVLQASAESFEKAGHQAKKEQVTKLLQKVRQDRELAVSLMQVLEAPTGASSTISFSAPTPTQETAAGLDRFMHADIQATVIGRPMDLHVGDDFSLEIELVNAGRGTAQLTKVEQVIPQGFEVREVPSKYRVEGNYLSMKGRRLDPLKTEDVKIMLKPTVQGSFILSPRIMYLDESGKYRSHEPESINVRVTELGISGWLKGPDKRK